ncbi:baseplate J/gp47 family protein [Shinella sp. DD12]|uniref:baseplate J/gp47 family protein n=1 Tax=Shinella sp. DD12 TaxID=1410620 RepID=UPI000437A19E|nr:baseplate J/gp47 family protein [Shinella sp. DD12]EYR81877.1 baseplate J family protein [Shinella sp. DD12]
MADAASSLDLSSLSAPIIIEQIDYEVIFQRYVAKFKEIWAVLRAANPDLPDYDVQMLETDPAIVIKQAAAYVEALLRADGNDKAKGLLLAYATGSALDHILATYHRTPRLPNESDDAYRARGQLAPEAMADLGVTHGGYIFRVRTAFSNEIKDVRPIRRGAGRIELRVLGKSETGIVPSATLAAIIRSFEPEHATQSTDILTVMQADIDERHVTINLKIPRGPDPASVKAASRKKLDAYAAAVHQIGSGLYVDALYAAAHVSPVITVAITGLSADVLPRPEAAIKLVIDDVLTEVL